MVAELLTSRRRVVGRVVAGMESVLPGMSFDGSFPNASLDPRRMVFSEGTGLPRQLSEATRQGWSEGVKDAMTSLNSVCARVKGSAE